MEVLENEPLQVNSAVSFKARFSIMETIGKGGFGEVKRVIEKKTNTSFAVKVPNAPSLTHLLVF